MSFKLPKLVVALCMVATLAACDSAEERADASYQSAVSLLETGDMDRAMVELRNALQFDENHRESRALMGQILLDQNRDREAYGQYLRLAEQYPDDLDSRIVLSQIAFSSRSWEELERHGAAAEALAPDDPRVQPITLARAYRDAAMTEDEARLETLGSEAQERLADQPDNEILSNIVIDNFSRSGDFAGALAEIDKLIAANPDSRTLYNQRVSLLTQTGDEEAIETALREQIALFPEDDNAKANLIRYYLSRSDNDKAEAFLREMADPTAEDAGPTVDLIRFLAEVRGTEAARVEIERAIAENPNPAPFQVMRATLDFSEGNPDEAIRNLEAVLEGAEPTDDIDVVRITLAQFYLATGNNVGSHRLVEETLADDPTNVPALKMQAAWQIEADETDEAIANLRTALDTTPDDPEAMQLMAQAYIRAGSPDLANDFLALAVEASGNAPQDSIRYARVLIDNERYLPAEDVLLPSLRLFPDNPDLLAMLGELYLRMEDIPRTDQVIATLRRAETPQTRDIANTLQIQRLAVTDGTEGAVDFIETLAGENADDLNAQLTLLRSRLTTGDIEGAVNLAESLAADNPDSPQVTLALAATRSASGDLETAAQTYSDFLAETPDATSVWLELSSLNARQGDLSAAMATIDDGLTANSGDPDLLWAKASILEQQNQIDDAIEIYEALYEDSSQSIVIANNLASLLATYRDDEESLERAYTIARRFSTTDIPALQDTYGWIMFRRGDIEQAIPYLEDAAQGLAQDPIVQYHLAAAYVAQGDTEQAIAQLQRTLDVAGPADTRPQIETARTELTRLQQGETQEN